MVPTINTNFCMLPGLLKMEITVSYQLATKTYQRLNIKLDLASNTSLYPERFFLIIASCILVE